MTKNKQTSDDQTEIINLIRMEISTGLNTGGESPKGCAINIVNKLRENGYDISKHWATLENLGNDYCLVCGDLVDNMNYVLIDDRKAHLKCVARKKTKEISHDQQ